MAEWFADGSRRQGARRRVLSIAGATITLAAGFGSLSPVSAQDASPAETYARLSADIDRAVRYDAHMERMLESQAEEIAALEAQLAGIEGTVASLEPLVERMYSELAAFVEADVPFLRSERMERLERLEQLVAQEGNVSEKFRRLLEAIQIELEYGRTLGTYSGVLEDGRPAEFVHVGRVALFYRTVDGRESGYWDATSRAWTIDQDNARAIRDVLAMAKEEVAPDLLILPVPAATEARR